MTSRSIFDILQNDLNPESWPDGAPSLLVAAAHWQQMRKNTDLHVVHRKLKGPRKAVRSFTFGRLSAKWPNDELIETHAPLLMFVLAGVTDYCCGDYMIQIPAGHALFVPAGVPRRTGAASLQDIEDNPQRHCDNILFSEHCGSLQIWLNHDRGNYHYRSGSNETLMVNNMRLIRLLEEMGEEVIETRPFHDRVTHSLLQVFLWSLQRALREKKAIQPSRLSNTEMASVNNYAPILTAQQYIREHLDEQLTQDKVARLVRLSRTQFIRRFREETGQTFNQFVTACRLEHAKVLLQETDFTIHFIGQSLGFKSPTYLNTLFQKQVGMLPTEFRALKRDQN